ncbi:hypothetical protein BKA80DRAFT_264396, partial [Phyllosticta citrichinensis]
WLFGWLFGWLAAADLHIWMPPLLIVLEYHLTSTLRHAILPLICYSTSSIRKKKDEDDNHALGCLSAHFVKMTITHKQHRGCNAEQERK